jgi:hypothetical protein
MTKRSYVEAVLAGLDEVEIATLDNASEAEVQAGKGTRIALGSLCSVPVGSVPSLWVMSRPCRSVPSPRFRSVSVGSLASPRLRFVSIDSVPSL